MVLILKVFLSFSPSRQSNLIREHRSIIFFFFNKFIFCAIDDHREGEFLSSQHFAPRKRERFARGEKIC